MPRLHLRQPGWGFPHPLAAELGVGVRVGVGAELWADVLFSELSSVHPALQPPPFLPIAQSGISWSLVIELGRNVLLSS